MAQISQIATSETEAEKACKVLIQAGLIRPLSAEPVEPISEHERLEAAHAYGAVGPLSDWIIRQRGEWPTI